MSKKKSNAGAKSKYNDEFPSLAEDWARQGLSDEQIAKNLGISIQTYYRYQKEYSKFCEAIKRGKRPVDFEVENALLKRALGFDVTETHTEAIISKDGKTVTGNKVKKVVKHYAPDVGACVFWLINRRKDFWKQRRNEEGKDDSQELQDVLNEFAKALKHGDKD